jgi:DNA-binding transcriptional MocR family regulator
MATTSLPTLQMVLRPGIIDLGWGHPDPALMPVEAVREATSAALTKYGPDALAYGAGQGPGPLIEWLRERIGRTEGRTPAPDELLITGGNSQALDQVCGLYARPGDTVLVEAPTYHLAVKILRDHPLRLVPVPLDEDGLQVDALAATIERLKGDGCRPRFLYTIPTYHNPTGACLGAERREALVALAVAEDFLIVEDDVYRELAYDGPPPSSLWSMAPVGRVLRLGSFAKSLAPGLRLGWATGDPTLIARMVQGGLLDSGGGINHFGAMAVAALCEAGAFDAQIARLRAAYREKRDALHGALTEYLPEGCAWARPGGGFFIWLRLPPDKRVDAVLAAAEAGGMAFAPGSRFAPADAASTSGDTLRLAFSYYSPERLREAARLLGAALHARG